MQIRTLPDGSVKFVLTVRERNKLVEAISLTKTISKFRETDAGYAAANAYDGLTAMLAGLDNSPLDYEDEDGQTTPVQAALPPGVADVPTSPSA